MAKFTKASGIIYRMYDSKDTDKIVCIIDQNGSKQAILAKGVKKQSSKKSHALNIGNFVTASVVGGYTIPLLSEISIIEEFAHYKKGYKELIALQFICDVFDKFVYEENPERDLFTLLFEVLSLQEIESIEYILSIALLKILYISGNITDLSEDSATGEVLNSERIYKVDNAIGYSNNGRAEIESRIYKTQRFILSTNLHTAIRVVLSQQEITKMLKLHVEWIEFILGHELKSKKMLYDVIR